MKVSISEYRTFWKGMYIISNDSILATQELTKGVIGKMFGSRHPPAPKIFYKFSRIFGVEGRTFFKFQFQIYT